jgi:hypothetical protein
MVSCILVCSGMGATLPLRALRPAPPALAGEPSGRVLAGLLFRPPGWSARCNSLPATPGSGGRLRRRPVRLDGGGRWRSAHSVNVPDNCARASALVSKSEKAGPPPRVWSGLGRCDSETYLAVEAARAGTMSVSSRPGGPLRRPGRGGERRACGPLQPVPVLSVVLLPPSIVAKGHDSLGHEPGRAPVCGEIFCCGNIDLRLVPVGLL